MYRLKDLNLRELHSVIDDIERRIRRLESSDKNLVSGYSMTYNEQDGTLVLTKGDSIITFAKV